MSKMSLCGDCPMVTTCYNSCVGLAPCAEYYKQEYETAVRTIGQLVEEKEILRNRLNRYE